MNEKMFGDFTAQVTNLLAPSRELNKLIISKLEQLTAIQLSSLREYADLNIGQLKAASEITTAEDLQEYYRKQQEFLRTLGEKLAADAQAMAAIGKEFSEEAQKIAMKGLSGPAKPSA